MPFRGYAADLGRRERGRRNGPRPVPVPGTAQSDGAAGVPLAGVGRESVLRDRLVSGNGRTVPPRRLSAWRTGRNFGRDLRRAGLGARRRRLYGPAAELPGVRRVREGVPAGRLGTGRPPARAGRHPRGGERRPGRRGAARRADQARSARRIVGRVVRAGGAGATSGFLRGRRIVLRCVRPSGTGPLGGRASFGGRIARIQTGAACAVPPVRRSVRRGGDGTPRGAESGPPCQGRHGSGHSLSYPG